jgi:hypothetical protein
VPRRRERRPELVHDDVERKGPRAPRLRVARKAREDPKAKMLPTGYVFFLVGASLAMLVLCGIQCKSTFCRTPVRYGGVGSDKIISVSDDPDDEGFEMSGSSSMV